MPERIKSKLTEGLPQADGSPFTVVMQGDPSGWLKHPIDLVPTVMADGWPLMQLPAAQTGWWNISKVNPGQMGHPVPGDGNKREPDMD